MDAIRRLIASDLEVRKALLATPGLPGEPSRFSIATNLIIAITMLGMLVSHVFLLRPAARFDDIPVADWIRTMFYFLDFIQPLLAGSLVLIGVWNAAGVYFLRRERRVVRKLLTALAPDLDPARLLPSQRVAARWT